LLSNFRRSGASLKFCELAECYATLRVLMDKFCKKNRQKKIQFFFSGNVLRNFFLIFFGYRGFTANLGYACKNLGCLGPLVLEEIDFARTVVNPKLKYIDASMTEN
jgi:hypothetical protein